MDQGSLGSCHVYAQYLWHSPARIVGDRVSLQCIRDAIDSALTTGMDQNSGSLFTHDGEGYHVEVQVRTSEYLAQEPLPYYAPYAGGVGYDCYWGEVLGWRFEDTLAGKAKAFLAEYWPTIFLAPFALSMIYFAAVGG